MADQATQAPTARVVTMRSPIFGQCRLVPHAMDEEPRGIVGYVAFEGDPNNLTVAVYSKGQWRGRNLKAFDRPIANWYSVEKADGSPLF